MHKHHMLGVEVEIRALLQAARATAYKGQADILTDTWTHGNLKSLQTLTSSVTLLISDALKNKPKVNVDELPKEEKEPEPATADQLYTTLQAIQPRMKDIPQGANRQFAESAMVTFFKALPKLTEESTAGQIILWVIAAWRQCVAHVETMISDEMAVYTWIMLPQNMRQALPSSYDLQPDAKRSTTNPLHLLMSMLKSTSQEQMSIVLDQINQNIRIRAQAHSDRQPIWRAT